MRYKHCRDIASVSGIAKSRLLFVVAVIFINDMFDNVLFISEIRKHPELWDPNHEEFNHRQAKQSAWEEVATNTFSDSENWSNYDKFGKGE